MPDDLLKAGEFARLCGTTKETLRHYRDIGLLVPVAKAKNGYQLYSPLQLSDYLLVSSLQQAGCSLHEIKGYLSVGERDGGSDQCYRRAAARALDAEIASREYAGEHAGTQRLAT